MPCISLSICLIAISLQITKGSLRKHFEDKLSPLSDSSGWRAGSQRQHDGNSLASSPNKNDRTLTLRIHMRGDPDDGRAKNMIDVDPNSFPARSARAGNSFKDTPVGGEDGHFKREVPCEDVECQNGICMISPSDYTPRCECYDGFSGGKCDKVKLECNENKWKCAGRRCENHHGTHICRCDNGLVGLNCNDNAVANPCGQQSSISQVHNIRGFGPSMPNLFAHCTSNNTFIARRCPRNLFWDQQAETCIREMPSVPTGLCASYPCANGGRCIDQGQNYVCACSPGYYGKDCTERADMCETNPCNGGRCRSWTGGFTCECPNKVFDKCCCNAVINRCARGVDFYSHNATSFVHCGPSGEAYLKSCPPGLLWKNDIKTCVRPNSFAHYSNPWDYSFKRSYNDRLSGSVPTNDRITDYEESEPRMNTLDKEEAIDIEVPLNGRGDFKMDIPLSSKINYPNANNNAKPTKTINDETIDNYNDDRSFNGNLDSVDISQAGITNAHAVPRRLDNYISDMNENIQLPFSAKTKSNRSNTTALKTAHIQCFRSTSQCSANQRRVT